MPLHYFVVLYRDDSLLPGDAPHAFLCEAEDSDHAEEQALNAYPDAVPVWTTQTDSVAQARFDYWNGAYN